MLSKILNLLEFEVEKIASYSTYECDLQHFLFILPYNSIPSNMLFPPLRFTL